MRHLIEFCWIWIFPWIKLDSLALCETNLYGSIDSGKLAILALCETNLDGSIDSGKLAILALCETNLDDSIDSGNFSVRGYLPLIQKNSITIMLGVAVYVKEGLLFAQNLSLIENCELCFWLGLLWSVSYFIFLYWLPSLSLCTALDQPIC